MAFLNFPPVPVPMLAVQGNGEHCSSQRRARQTDVTGYVMCCVLILACEPLAYHIKPSPPSPASPCSPATTDGNEIWNGLHLTAGADPVSNDSWKAKGKVWRRCGNSMPSWKEMKISLRT